LRRDILVTITAGIILVFSGFIAGVRVGVVHEQNIPQPTPCTTTVTQDDVPLFYGGQWHDFIPRCH